MAEDLLEDSMGVVTAYFAWLRKDWMPVLTNLADAAFAKSLRNYIQRWLQGEKSARRPAWLWQEDDSLTGDPDEVKQGLADYFAALFAYNDDNKEAASPEDRLPKPLKPQYHTMCWDGLMVAINDDELLAAI